MIESLSDQPVNWGASPVPYYVSTILTKYGQSPACEYLFNFEAFLLNPDPQDPVQLLDLPPWFNFNPYTLVFGLEKCGSNNSLNDADCIGSPFDATYVIVIKAALNDSYGTYDTSASFAVNVNVMCKNDYFSFDTSNDVFTYYLRSPAVPATYYMPLQQYIPSCGLECYAETTGAGVFADFSSSTGAFVISSDDKSLSGASLSITLNCRSPDSTQAGGIQTKTITINYKDECWDGSLS